MTIAPHSGLTLTTHGTADQAAYHYISYANPTTIGSTEYSTNSGAAVLGTAYGTTTVPHWTLVNLSTIVGYGGVELLNGGLVDNHVQTSAIYGHAGTAVYISNSAGTVINQGTIQGSGTAAGNGVDLESGGAVTNGSTSNAYAYISAQSAGVVTRGSANITNYGSFAGQTALYLGYGGTVTNIQNIQQHAIDTLAHNAAIRGDTVAGIIVANAAATITNNGIIRGAIGILGTTGAPVTLHNSGRIYGANRAGIDIGPAVSLHDGGLIDNQFVETTVSTGTVGNYATVTLAGRLTGGYSAVAADKPATVVNDSLIRAYAAYGVGVNLFAGGTISNGGLLHAGTIIADHPIILQGGPGLLDNYGGLIEGTGTYSSSFAVRTDGTVVNVNGGIIIGGAGVGDDETIVGTVTILPMIYNDGSIIATYAAVSVSNFGGTAKAAATVANYNLIQGGNFGISVDGANATITNLGTIKASHGIGFRYPAAGIYLSLSTGTIRNGADNLTSAYIFGKYQGIYAQSSDVTIANYGTIKGGVGITTYGGTHTNTVANFGTIIGTSSDSVFFGKGNSRLVVGPGAVFVGNVFGNAGTNVLELDTPLTGSAAGTLIGLSTSFANFSTILVDPDANWYIDGSDFVNIANSGGTITNVGTLNVRPHQSFLNNGSIGGGITITNSATLRNVAGRISNGDDAVVGTGTAALLRNSATIVDNGATGAGVVLMKGGTIVNGAPLTTTAAITGVNYGIRAEATEVVNAESTTYTPGATLTNYGTVTGSIAVRFLAGGLISNGLTSDTVALISGSLAGVASQGGSLINDATISGGGVGVIMYAAETILNGSTMLTTPLISGGIQGIYVKGTSGGFYFTTIGNFGTVSGNEVGIYVIDGYGTIVNGASNSTAALITGQQSGIAITTNGTAGAYPTIGITNFGTISGTTGVASYDATLLSNTGTIIGSDGTAVAFGAGNDELVEFPGAVLNGTVNGGAGHNYLELGAGTFGSLGDLFGFGTSIVNFATVAVETNAAWQFVGHSTFAPSVTLTNNGAMYAGTFDDLRISTTLHADPGGHGVVIMKNAGTVELLGSVAADQAIYFSTGGNVLDIGNTGQFAGTIHGFDHTGLIDLVNLSANAAQWSANVLTVKSGGIVVAELDLVGSFTGAHFFIGPDNGGSGPGTAITTDLGAPCFAAGTRISTDRGEVPVEDLRVGDRVLEGRVRDEVIVSITHRTIDCRRHPQPRRVWPVRVAAHAFGHNQPHRDLFLSPDHAVFTENVLIPIKHLINGTTIVQLPSDTITYFHVELPRHAVLLAEGLEAESYLATDDARPDVAWEAQGCAPLIVSGPILDAVRRRVARLAARYASGKLAA
jgi:Hint domain